jgi:superfamily II DNA or RNA helicase
VERARVDRNVVRLDVSHDCHRLTVLAPFDRPEPVAPSPRPRRVRRQQAAARLAWLCGSAFGARDLRALARARIQLLPYQLEPALAALDGQRRILIADVVGLGKTIQAGLLLAELAGRNPSFRALVLVPAGLRTQWRDELRARFDLEAHSAEYDLPLADQRTDRHDNPWKHPGIWLASVDYIKQPHVLDGMPPAAWDLLVIDEAHTVSGPSNRYAACDELGRRSRCVVLLSATPHTGEDSRFRRLMQLGALPLPSDTIEVFRRTRAHGTRAAPRVLRWRRSQPTPELAHLFDALQQFERILLQRARASRRDAALLLLCVFRKRALSTARALDRSLARRLEWLASPATHQVAFPLPHQSMLRFDDEDEDAEEEAAIAADVGLPAAHERTWLKRLRTLAQAAVRREPKLDWLKRIAARTREPLVVFTEFRDTLETVRRALEAHRTVAVLHGGQSDAVRQQELARFLAGTASVLLSTDAGGQGLNLQSRARWVVVFDLPWNPTRLEQRIGRVDRIGQTRRVHATLLLTAHAAEDPLLTALARRALSAERTMGDATLADCAPPTQLALAEALFAGAALPNRQLAAPTLALSTRWRRTAAAMARLVTRRRALLARWRARDEPAARPIASRRLRAAPHAGILLVFSALVLDRGGGVAGRFAVALRLAATAKNAWRFRDDRRDLEAVATRHLRARVARLCRVLAERTARQIDVERTVAAHIHALQYPEEAQLGLFSQRETRAFSRARQAAAHSSAGAASRIDAVLDRAHVELCEPRLEWIGPSP